MTEPTRIQHPLLQRFGTSQRKRSDVIIRSGPESAPLDGRSIGDILDFIHQYARQLVFYAAQIDDKSQQYVELSNWLAFFEDSLPFVLNRFTRIDFNKLETDLKRVSDELDRDPSEASLYLLLDFVYFDLFEPIERFQQRVQEYSFDSLTALLDHHIKTTLLPPLRRFIELSNGSASYFQFNKLDFTNFIETPWEIPFEETLQTDVSFIDVPGGRDGAIRWLGKEIYEDAKRFLKAEQVIADKLPHFLEDSISFFEKRHEPHVGLLFAFLRLFKQFQGDLNSLTQKHLDYFYIHVLKLRHRNLMPDRVHLIFETAKHLPTHLIEQGTLFKATKDSNSIDILFSLDDQIIVDKALVVSLKTLYLDRSLRLPDVSEEVETKGHIHELYIAPVADSADGKGEAFTETASKNWPTLGAKLSKFIPTGESQPAQHPFGRSGFVLASQVLWLNEGDRAISIRIDCKVKEFDDWYDYCFKQAFGEFSEGSILKITEAARHFLEDKTFSDESLLLLKRDFKKASELEFPRILNFDQQDQIGSKKKGNNIQSKVQEQSWEDYLSNYSERDQRLLKERVITEDDGETHIIKAFDPTLSILSQWLKTHEGQEFIIEENDTFDFSEAVHKSSDDFQVPENMLLEVADQLEKIEGVRLLDISNYLKISFSGEKSWFSPEKVKVYLVQYPDGEEASVTLRLETFLQSGEPSIAFYKEDRLTENFVSNCLFPMVKVELQTGLEMSCDNGMSQDLCCLDRIQQEKMPVGVYHFLRHLHVINTDICVYVDGVKNLVVQNEESLQDVNSLIYPFGVRPKLYSEFYVGCKELLCKNWQEFSLNIEWKDKPVVGFKEHYSSYEKYADLEVENNLNIEISDDLFKIDRAILEDGKWFPLDEVELYPDPLSSTHHYGFSRADMPNVYKHTFKRFDDSILNPKSIDSRDAFFSLTLRGASFQHAIYPMVLGQYMVELASIENESPIEYEFRFPGDGDSGDATNSISVLRSTIPKDPGKLPKEPYTPMIKTISIDYSARSEKVELIHLYPFAETSKSTGWCDLDPSVAIDLEDFPTLLPSHNDEGSLFIGCENLRPNANLNLLFQFAEASADTESESADISWSYLLDNNWKDLRPGFEVIKDETEQLTRSGVVTIALPGNISNVDNSLPDNFSNRNNSLMPLSDDGKPLFWLKVSAQRNVASVAELLGVHAQAAQATYAPKEGSDLSRVGSPLASEQVGKPLQPNFAIKSVLQPYKSFGGRLAEAEGLTPVRMGELLRHKDRGVDPFDIEHLVLDAFPELFKCKCISHTLGLSANQYRRDLEVAPGFLVVAVVPDLNKLDPGNLLQPRAPRSVLGRVEEFLRARLSMFARVRVMNPRYEPIHVNIIVKLKPGVDKNYYLEQLKIDMGRLLSPWYLGDSDKLSFGQQVSYSDVLRYVEGLAYIDQVTSMQLYDFRSPPDVQSLDHAGLKTIVPLTARSILTCTPANIQASLHDPKCCELRKLTTGNDDLVVPDQPRTSSGAG